MAASSAPFGFLPSGAFSGLRRSVIDPDTGLPVVTSAPTGEVVQRSALLPIGRDDSGSLTPAVPGLLTGMADAAAFPGQVARGEASITGPDGHVTDEAVGRAFDLAGTAMTGSLPFSAPGGALRMFGGRSARTADLARLGQAAEMEAKGAFPSEIHSATGWHAGADGLPRFEISDDAARLTPFPPASEAPLGLVLDHPDLYRAYPEMRDVRVQHRPEMGRDAGANPDDNLIALNLGDRDALSSLLHEGQHMIQGREGFARGGSPADFTSATAPLFGERRASENALDTYRRLAGEVEARNVQGRRSMSADERAGVPPWQTQDVPDAGQIVRFGSAGPMPGLASVTDAAPRRIPQASDKVSQFTREKGPTAGLSVASRAPPMYDLVPRPARPLEADYPAARWPDGPPIDASGRLTRDIDGRPLNPGARVVGRSLAGGADEVLSPEELDALATRALGAGPVDVASRAIPGGGVGAYRRVQDPEGLRRTVYVDRALAPPARGRVVAHEFGHAVDEIAGDFVGSGPPMPFAIPQTGISKELGTLFNETSNVDFRAALDRTGDIGLALARSGKNRGYKPEMQGYKPADAPAEYMAEAIRGYMADPNAMKAAYPNTAARIREAVNDSPTLSPHIQFNGLPAALGLGAGAAAIFGGADDAQAAPTPGTPPMSAGSAPFGFGAPPQIGPEDMAALMARMRARQGDPQADMPAPNAAPASFLTGPRDPNGGFFVPPADRALAPAGDPSGPRPSDAAPAMPSLVGAQMPGMGLGGLGAPQPPAAPPQGVTGLPPSFGLGAPPAPRVAPAPAAAGTDDATPAMPLPPRRPAEFGSLAPSAPQADLPATGAVPASGQAPADAGYDFGAAADRFRKNGGFDLLGNLGIGLMSTRGFGAGLAKGLTLDQEQQSKKAVTDLAKAKFGIEQAKATRETGALVGNAAIIKRAFPNLSDAEAVAAGGNGGQVTEALKILRDPNHGRENDPAIIKARAQATAEGTAAGAKDDVQLITRPDGSIVGVNKSRIGETDGPSALTPVAPATGGTRIWGTAGPDGKPVQAPPDTPPGTPGYYDEKGAPHVSLTQGTNQLPAKANGELDAAAVKAITEGRAKAEGAVGTIAAINRQKEALDRGIVSGWGSDWRTQARAMTAQILGIPDSYVTQSQLFDQAATQKAAELAKAISQAGHTTNMDLQLGKTISSGDRSSVEAALRAGIDAQELLAKKTIERHNSSVDRFATPETAQRSGFFKVEQPEVYQYKPAAPDRSAVEAELRRRGMLR